VAENGRKNIDMGLGFALATGLSVPTAAQRAGIPDTDCLPPTAQVRGERGWAGRPQPPRGRLLTDSQPRSSRLGG